MVSTALTIIGMLVVSYMGLALTLYFMQPKFVYDPIKELPYTPAELGLDFEQVTFRTGDRLNLHGWFVPASAKPLGEIGTDFTVLYCHGNGGNMMFFLDTVNLLNGLGLNCFIFDYRGYGSSQGSPSENGTYLDVRAAYRWLTKKKGIPQQKIIIFGWSLGGSVAAYLAARTRSAGLVIEGAFTSYADIGSKYYPYMPVRWFARFKYPTIDYVRKVKCPILVIHSRDDETVPFEFGLELYDAANEPKEFVELRGGHNEAYLISSETYKKSWLKWLAFLTDSAKIDSPRQKSV
ncbi:MAG: alpha/beta hydrolase [Planctomycetota bacterium]